MIFNEAFTEQTHYIFEKIQDLDINNESSHKKALASIFHEKFKKTHLKSLLISFFTLGFYAYRLKKECEKDLLRALAARKFYYLHELKQVVETARHSSNCHDPKLEINKIYKKVLQSKKPSFRNIYTKYDLYLLITIPFQEEKISDFFHKKSKKKQALDFIHSWNVLMKRLKMEEVKNIQLMNQHYNILKNRYLLTKKEIHSRLKRTTLGQKSPEKLTTLPTLCIAFEEIIHAFETFKNLRQNKPEVFKLLSLLLYLPSHLYENLTHTFEVEKLSMCEDFRDFLLEIDQKKDCLHSLCLSKNLRPLLLILNDAQARLVELLCQKVPEDSEVISLENV